MECETFLFQQLKRRADCLNVSFVREYLHCSRKRYNEFNVMSEEHEEMYTGTEHQ